MRNRFAVFCGAILLFSAYSPGVRASEDLAESRKIKPKKDVGNIASNFNGTAIPAGGTVWFSSVMKVKGNNPKSKVTIRFTGQTISLNGQTVTVPDSIVVLDPNVTVATTTFNAPNGPWLTFLPTSNLAGSVFLGGLTYQVPQGLPGGLNPVVWNGTFTSDTKGITVEWQWAAAAYSCAFCNCQVNPKPVDDNHASTYQNSDHAGTPETGWIKSCVTGGARGGGGSNWTGSLSGTAAVTPTCTKSETPKSSLPGAF